MPTPHHHLTRRAREIVQRLGDAQARRLALLEPDHIPLALGPEAASRYGREEVALLRAEISRLCRSRTLAA